MNRPEFANEDHAIPPRMADDGKVHLPTNPFQRLLKYKNDYYRINHFEINGWREGEYVIAIRASQPNEIFKEKVDCPEIDTDKTFVYESMDFQCHNFAINKEHHNIRLDLTHSVISMIDQLGVE